MSKIQQALLLVAGFFPESLVAIMLYFNLLIWCYQTDSQVGFCGLNTLEGNHTCPGVRFA